MPITIWPPCKTSHQHWFVEVCTQVELRILSEPGWCGKLPVTMQSQALQTMVACKVLPCLTRFLFSPLVQLLCIIYLLGFDCASVSRTPSIQLNPYAQAAKTLCHGRNNPSPTSRVDVIIGRSHLAVLEDLDTHCALHHVMGERACEATLHHVAASGGPAPHTQPMPDVNQCKVTGDQQCSHG